MKKIEIYIDGAVRGNQFDKNLGAWGVILKFGNDTKELGGIIEDTTNNVCEITAAISALSNVKNKTLETIVTSDSQYVVSGVNEWSKRWVENGWKTARKKPIENVGLWQWLLDLTNQFSNLAFEKCEGHSGNEWNDNVDALCNRLLNEYEKEHPPKKEKKI
jgi:ribonuclease HI